MQLKPTSVQGYLMILLSAIGYGSYGIWSRLMGKEFGVFSQGWIRSILVLIILIPIAVITKNLRPVERKDLGWIFVPVLLGSLSTAPAYYAFNHMGIGTATLLYYAFFLVTSYVVGTLFLKEKITLVKLISLFLALIGLLLIFGFSLTKFSLLAVGAAIMYGVTSGGEVSSTKKSSHSYSSLQVSIYVWLGALVINLLASFLFKETQLPASLDTAWLGMIIFALTGLIVFWLAVEGFKHIDASIGSLIGLMEIISGVAFGILLFHEHITLSILIGGMLIIFAAMLPDLINLILKKYYTQPTPADTPVI